jgi:hypothetical protein
VTISDEAYFKKYPVRRPRKGRDPVSKNPRVRRAAMRLAAVYVHGEYVNCCECRRCFKCGNKLPVHVKKCKFCKV